MPITSPPDGVEYRRITADDVPAFADVLNAVIAERRWLGAIRPHALAGLYRFVEELDRLRGFQLLALDRGRIVGWCDVMPGAGEATAH